MNKKLQSVSKFLSYVLRHQPEAIGLELNAGGWAAISDLIACATSHNHVLSVAIIEQVVAVNDKQRFGLSEDGQYIRANQGHSIAVDLDLRFLAPPPSLFHGTATRFLESILASGLLPSGRQYVHLSAEYETAIAVGKRHGIPIILKIDTQQMYRDGHLFYCSENGVWLTQHVPSQYFWNQDELAINKNS